MTASRLYDMEKTRTKPPGTPLFIGAAIAGLLHAAPSFYWMCGGMWLLDTVGPMAVKLQQEGNVPVRFLLAAVFIAKVTGALVPLIYHLRPPAHAWVRIVSWVGSIVLIGWGGRGTFVGWWRVVIDQASLSNPLVAGHTYLWSPLFLVWGLLLFGALFISRARRQKVPSTG